MDGQRSTPTARLAGIVGALYGLAATALAAIGSHAFAPGLGPADLYRLVLAIAFLFVHALLLVLVGAIARRGGHGVVLAASALLIALGTLLFSGSLLARILFGWPTLLAPFGGVALMLGWLALAAWFAFARRA